MINVEEIIKNNIMSNIFSEYPEEVEGHIVFDQFIEDEKLFYKGFELVICERYEDEPTTTIRQLMLEELEDASFLHNLLIRELKNDVKIEDSKLSCELELTAFDIARYGKDELYNMAQSKFNELGHSLEITDMKMIPIKIDEDYVTYRCIPTSFEKSED